jgi:hypothetical protein
VYAKNLKVQIYIYILQYCEKSQWTSTKPIIKKTRRSKYYYNYFAIFYLVLHFLQHILLQTNRFLSRNYLVKTYLFYRNSIVYSPTTVHLTKKYMFSSLITHELIILLFGMIQVCELCPQSGINEGFDFVGKFITEWRTIEVGIVLGRD